MSETSDWLLYRIRTLIMKMISRDCKQLFLFLILFYFSCLGEPASLLAQSNWAEDSLLIEQLNLKAWRLKNPQPDSARTVAERAIAYSDKHQYRKGRADGVHILGLLEWIEGDMSQALSYYLEALNLRQAINDSLGLGRSFNNIGNVYFQLEQFDSAEVYYQHGLDIRHQLNDVAGLIYSYSNLGDVALEKEAFSTADSFYMRGQALALHDSIFSGLAHVGGRLGKLALQRGDRLAAQSAWEQAVVYAEKSGNRRFLASAIQEEIRMAMLNNQLDIRRHTNEAHRSLQLSNEIGAVDLQAEAAIILAQLAAAAGDLSTAYFYQTQYRQLTEALMQEQENKAVTAIRDQYAAQQLAQDRLATERRNSAELSRTNTQLIIWSLGIFAFLLGGTLLRSYRAYRKQSDLVKKLEGKNRELDARYDDLQEFAKIASHDLKEPVRNIGAFANLIERRYAVKLDKNGMEYLEFIIDSASRMNNLLDDLLIFSNIPRYEKEALQATSMNQLVGEVVAQKKKEQGAFKFVGTTLPLIHAYPVLIKILLTQLLDNGLKFNKSENKCIELGYRSDGYYHHFLLSDNGPGIEEAYQAQIFDIFRQLHKRDQQSTGMGLAICKRVIETHQGQIWVESKLGQGSTFVFTIPRHTRDEVPILHLEKKEAVLVG